MQFFPTAVCNVTAWRHSRRLALWQMELVGGGGGGVREKNVFCVPRELQRASHISVLSMGGVCGRSLTAGKILFAGRQTFSLYLVLWLCAMNTVKISTHLSFRGAEWCQRLGGRGLRWRGGCDSCRGVGVSLPGDHWTPLEQNWEEEEKSENHIDNEFDFETL